MYPCPLRFFTKGAALGLICNAYTTQSACVADTANVCAWNPANTPACNTLLISTAEFQACANGTAISAICDLFQLVRIHCDMNEESRCKVRSGCKWEQGACSIRPEKSYGIALDVADSQGSSYTKQVLAMDSQCSAYTDRSACVTAKTSAPTPSGGSVTTSASGSATTPARSIVLAAALVGFWALFA